jgi:hypothetical protein
MSAPRARRTLDPGALLPLLAAAAAALIAQLLLDGAAHVEDEATYRWQAAQLLAGRLGGPPPELQAWVPLTYCRGDSCFGAFPSGWPAVLALGVAAQVPWLVNPLLHGLLTWRAGALARRLGGDASATAAALLVGFAPQTLLLGASGMSHTWVALLALIAAELAVVWRAGGGKGARRVRLALAMGALTGLCFLARPLCGVLLGGLLAVSCPGAWLGLLPIAAAGALQAALNSVTSGDMLAWPIEAWVRVATDFPATCNALGFGPERGCIPGRPPGHDLAGAAANTLHNLQMWVPLVGGAPVVLLAVAAAFRREPGARTWLGFGVATVLAYGLYWFDGGAYGARFYHVATPLVLVTAALALGWMPPFAWIVVGLGLAAGHVAALPELPGYWGVDGRAERLARSWDAGPATILVDTRALGPRVVDHPHTGPAGTAFEMPPRHNWAGANALPGDVRFADISALPAAPGLGRPVWVWEMKPDPADDRLLRLTGAGASAD